MEFFGLLWNEIITKPMTNSLLLLYVLLFNNLGLAILHHNLAFLERLQDRCNNF